MVAVSPGIGRKNCGCSLCHQDRILFGCENPGQCVETAKMLIGSILAKWNPTTENLDLSEELMLTDEELQLNEQALGTDQVMVFDPNFTLADMNRGFRIFALEESLDTIPARSYRLGGQAPSLMTVFLHAQILHPGEFDSRTRVMIKIETEFLEKSEIWNLTFDREEIPHSFSAALFGSLLVVLQNTEKNLPLLICSSSDFLSRALVKEGQKFENDFLDPKLRLLKAVFAALNERVARVQLKKVSENQAKLLRDSNTRDVEVDTEIDLMFECPGVLLSHRS